MIQDKVLATARYHADESRYALEHHSLSKLIRATRAAENSGFSIADAAIDSLNDLSWVADIGHRWLSHHSTGQVTSPIFPGSPADGGSDVIKTGLVHRTSGTAIALQAFDAGMLRGVKAQLADAEIDVLVGRPNVLKIVNQGTLTLEIADYETILANQDFDQPLRAISRQQITISKDTQPLLIDGRRQAFRFIDATNDPLAVNVADLANALPFRIHAARKDGVIVAVHANDDKDNIVRTMISVLRQLDTHEREPILLKYANHSAHFVRWHAMRELALLKGKQLLPELDYWASNEPSAYLKRYIGELQSFVATHED